MSLAAYIPESTGIIAVMKRFLACFCLIAAPFSAQANTELARQWGVEANRLSIETTDLITAVDLGEPAEITDRYALDVYRFGRTSADLARWIDHSNGPNDLGCIFRGMATESEVQLSELETPTEPIDQRESLRRLAIMFADAEMIAIAAQRRAPARAVGIDAPVNSCSGDAEMVLQALR
ncbi:MAG: hypothetical protein AAF437_03830 [Pseudomonadota bacterium]